MARVSGTLEWAVGMGGGGGGRSRPALHTQAPPSRASSLTLHNPQTRALKLCRTLEQDVAPMEAQEAAPAPPPPPAAKPAPPPAKK